MDTIGWVADMVNGGAGKPSELLCPSSPCHGTEKLNPYIGTTTIDPSEGGDPLLLHAGAYQAIIDAGSTGTAVKEHFIDKGYNTNYMTTWFMVRTGPALVWDASNFDLYYPSGSKIKSARSKYTSGASTIQGTLGPITRSLLDRAAHPTSVIPLMGDANVGDIKEAYLSDTVDESVASLRPPPVRVVLGRPRYERRCRQRRLDRHGQGRHWRFR